ncbi:hypothetical protein PENSPDRAFT_738515 [Peniophora sp. CONT]|nr:hypothetical protein PENSPDRAFT_738515 [Peniophora sp. CONT]
MTVESYWLVLLSGDLPDTETLNACRRYLYARNPRERDSDLPFNGNWDPFVSKLDSLTTFFRTTTTTCSSFQYTYIRRHTYFGGWETDPRTSSMTLADCRTQVWICFSFRAMLRYIQNKSATRAQCYISHLPLEVLQECLAYLPFVFDQFAEIHRCNGEYKPPQNRDEFFRILLENNNLVPGRRRVTHAGEDRLSPANRPGAEVVRPLDELHWRRPSLRRECQNDCRIEYWNWLDIRRVCVSWKHAADGCPVFNARVALQSKETAIRSLSQSGDASLYLYASLDAGRWEAQSFIQFFLELLENNMHRIKELSIVAEPDVLARLWNAMRQRRTFARSAPMLENFEINSLVGSDQTYLLVRPSDLFAAEDIPHLRHVFVRGCRAPYTCSLFHTSLVSLVVHGHGADWATYTQMVDALSQFQRLEVLSLCFQKYAAPRIDAETTQFTSIDLPYLRTLNLQARRPLLAMLMAHVTLPSTTETHFTCFVDGDDDRELLYIAGGDHLKRRLGVINAHYEEVTFHRNYKEGYATLLFSNPRSSDGTDCHALPTHISVKAVSRSSEDIYQCTHFLRAARLATPCHATRLRIIVTHNDSPLPLRGAEERLWDACLGDTSVVTEARLHGVAGREFIRRLSGGGLQTSGLPNLQRMVFVGLHRLDCGNMSYGSGERGGFIENFARALKVVPRGVVLEMEGCTITPFEEENLRAIAAGRRLKLSYECERLISSGSAYWPGWEALLVVLVIATVFSAAYFVVCYIVSWLSGAWISTFDVAIAFWVGYATWAFGSWSGSLLIVAASGCALYLTKL